ncbi:uncharacterized protein LOC131616770 [Vicia villosa]|uniref:uncharacterized protein LOC131616770 n=1 Tax=Vicia villosa TaxID=3911 RepID=UPI00273C9E5B|nr:uncharacterized protein LOC131616770 [Vicia villosa]
MSSETKAAEYFCKDFEWEQLRSEIESNPSLCHHFDSSSSSSSQSPQSDVQAWKQFHIRHSSGKFFKERRYLLKEFPQLLSSPANYNPRLLEVGCGNGSTVLPILRENKDVIVYACDCSDETLDRAKEIINVNANGDESFKHRFRTFCCDVSTNGFPNWLACNPCRENYLQKQSDVKEDNGLNVKESCSSEGFDCCVGGVDFVTLIFTLSAVPLERMPRSIKECFSVLKPGGMVLFRDYGLYDMTMLRFEPDKRVGFREYMRSDGTRSYFFCLNTVRNLFLGAGFIELELDYCCVKSVNRKKGKSMQRVWVHGKFQKPALW